MKLKSMAQILEQWPASYFFNEGCLAIIFGKREEFTINPNQFRLLGSKMDALPGGWPDELIDKPPVKKLYVYEMAQKKTMENAKGYIPEVVFHLSEMSEDQIQFEDEAYDLSHARRPEFDITYPEE